MNRFSWDSVRSNRTLPPLRVCLRRLWEKAKISWSFDCAFFKDETNTGLDGADAVGADRVGVVVVVVVVVVVSSRSGPFLPSDGLFDVAVELLRAAVNAEEAFRCVGTGCFKNMSGFAAVVGNFCGCGC